MLATLNKQTLHRCGAEAARRAHNPEVIRSKRIAGIYTSVVLKKLPTYHRDGAGVARGADNPEVTGSKPVPGILHFARFTETNRHSSRTRRKT